MMLQPIIRKRLQVYPQWLTTNAIVAYIIALAIVSFVNSSYTLPWYYVLTGVGSILAFFLYGRTLAGNLDIIKVRKEKAFEKRLFWIAFIPRVLTMVLIYWIYQSAYGQPFAAEDADAHYYDELGSFLVDLVQKGNYNFHEEIVRWSGNDDIADMGYGTYVGLIYYFTGKSIFAVRLIKSFWSALTVLLIYRLAKRNFDTQTARVAAIFVALWPNFWYYCGSHLKETEMVFLTVLFIEQADQMLRSGQFTAWKVIPVLLIVAALFTFRTVLGLVAIMALVFTVMMSSTRVVNWGKRIVVGGFAILLIGVTAGNRIQEQAEGMLEQVQGGQQRENMEWRAKRTDAGENVQKFSKYASATVFAPLIFTIPFPTMVRPYEGQEMQQMLNGGYFIKNILSSFVILALVILLISGKWRDHILPLSMMSGYIVVLVFSNFAQSERFHQPAMPFEMMFAAYGLSIAMTKPKYKRWFTFWCIFMVIAAIAWNWFKLAGRGLA